MAIAQARRLPVVRLTAAFLLFIAAVIVLADTRRLGPLGMIYEIRHADKAGHFLLFGLLAMLVNLAFFQIRRRVAVAAAAITSAVVALAVSLEELSQLFVPARAPDWYDLLWGYAGIAVFTWLAWRIAARHRSRGLARE